MRLGQIIAETRSEKEYRLVGVGMPPSLCLNKAHSGKASWQFGEASAFVAMPARITSEFFQGRFAFRIGESLPYSTIALMRPHVEIRLGEILVNGKRIAGMEVPLNTWMTLGFVCHRAQQGRISFYVGQNHIASHEGDLSQIHDILIGGPWGAFWLDDYYLDALDAFVATAPPVRRFMPILPKSTPNDDGYASANAPHLGKQHKVAAVMQVVAGTPKSGGQVEMQVFDGQNKVRQIANPAQDGVSVLRLERQPDGSEWTTEDFAAMRWKFDPK